MSPVRLAVPPYLPRSLFLFPLFSSDPLFYYFLLPLPPLPCYLFIYPYPHYPYSSLCLVLSLITFSLCLTYSGPAPHPYFQPRLLHLACSLARCLLLPFRYHQSVSRLPPARSITNHGLASRSDFIATSSSGCRPPTQHQGITASGTVPFGQSATP
jgi:hypothetical protein